jgi:hypothetical protein
MNENIRETSIHKCFLAFLLYDILCHDRTLPARRPLPDVRQNKSPFFITYLVCGIVLLATEDELSVNSGLKIIFVKNTNRIFNFHLSSSVAIETSESILVPDPLCLIRIFFF